MDTNKSETSQGEQTKCQIPRAGWECTRQAGHEGPCAAIAKQHAWAGAVDDAPGRIEWTPEFATEHHGLPVSIPFKRGWIKGHPEMTIAVIEKHDNGQCMLGGAFIPDDQEDLSELSEADAKQLAESFLSIWIDKVGNSLCGVVNHAALKQELSEAKLDVEHAQKVALADLQKSCVPGMWKCPKCSFVQVNSVIAPGGVYVNSKPELRPCPNDGRDLLPVSWKEHADDLAATCKELLQDRVLLRGLIALGNKEDRQGRWRVTLDWDNHQDGARVLDGDGHVIADCYDLETQDDPEADVEAKFIEAIRRACAAREREEGGGE